MIAERGGEREIIGVTGFIGSGKSRVSHFLADKLVCRHIDADMIARNIMAPGERGWLAIRQYNPAFINADGQLDRVQLRHEIFSNPSVKDKIDSLIHPLVQNDIEEKLGSESGQWVVVEVPLLFEAGWEKIFTRIILVYAQKGVCLKRVVARDDVSLVQAEKSYQSQMGASEKINMADHIIDNSGSWWDTQLQVLHLVDILTS